MDLQTELLKMIQEKKARIIVIGLGHVGLPTSLMFANAGYRVIGVDIDKDVVRNLNNDHSHINEKGINELLNICIKNGTFTAVTDLKKVIDNNDIIIISVPTPLTGRRKPDLNQVVSVCEILSKNSLKHKLIIIESSLPPGSTTSLIVPLLEKESNLKCGSDFWVTYVPERMTPGKAIEELTNNTRIIGAVEPNGAELARTLYETVIKNTIIVTDAKVAETAKLAENTYRFVNIALANELAEMCVSLGIDVMKVIEISNTHPRVKYLTPGAGVGGPCLPKDPYLLLNPIDGGKIDFKLLTSAKQVNDSMPARVVQLTKTALRDQKKDLKGSVVLCLGVTYKGDINDARETPAKEIINLLLKSGSEVLVYDPYQKLDFGAKRVDNIFELTQKVDAVIIITDHREFKQMDLAKLKSLMKSNGSIIDGRRIIDPERVRAYGMNYYAIGYG